MPEHNREASSVCLGVLTGRRCAALAALALCACSSADLARVSDGHRDSPATGHSPAASVAPALEPYPPGRWRLITFDKREQIVLWLSHILVMHEESRPADMPFLRSPEWIPDVTSGRTPERARELALEVAAQAQKQPASFAALAAKHSDDVVTRDHGGSLGGLRAGQIPAAFLDAIATMKPGEVSRPVETALGYHLLLWRPPPSAQQVAGQRIVIRYRGTAGVGEPPARSRAEALRLALELAERARATRFEELARKHGDTQDAERDGDLGTWSTLDPGHIGREIETLAALPVGGVSAPLDTMLGFQLLKRTEVGERESYAVATLELGYDAAAASGNESSRNAVAQLAATLGARMRAQPAAFDSLRAQYCCSEPQRWTLGRGPVRIEKAARHLAVGQLHLTPIDTGEALVFVKRIALDGVPQPAPVAYALPTPAAPDLSAIIVRAKGDRLAQDVRELATDLRKSLHLPPKDDLEVQRAFDELAVAYEGSSDAEARLQSTERARQRLSAKLGPATYERCRRFIDAWSSSRMLRVPML